MSYKGLLIVFLLSCLPIDSFSQVVTLTEKQARGIINLYDEYQFKVEEVELLKKDTSDYLKIIRNQSFQIKKQNILNHNLSAELKQGYESNKTTEKELAKQKSKHRKTTSALLVISGVLLAILLVK